MSLRHHFKIKNEEIILDYLSGSDIITRIFIKLRMEDQSIVEDVTMEARGWSNMKKEP